MAGNVFRFDPPIRLPALGIAALIAVAAAPPLPAKVVDASAYVRPPENTLREQKPLRPWFALFQPAAPVYNYSGRVLQNRASYPYPTPQDARIEWTVLKPRAPWFATFAPADPVYRYGGRVLQNVAAYPYPTPQDAQREWLPLKPWYAAFVIPPQFPYSVANQSAANVRPPEQRNEWLKILAPWFTPYAPANPIYTFTGPTLQDVANFPYPTPQDARREWLPLQPSTLLFNITKTTPHTPISGLFYSDAPPVRVEAGKPWFATFAAADPIYVYNGPPIQQAAYVRPPEQRNERLDNLAPWYASFDVGLYPFGGAALQAIAPYLRDVALPQLSVRFTQGAVAPLVPYVGLPYIAQPQETRRYVAWNAAPFTASDTIPATLLPLLARAPDIRVEAMRPWFAVFAPADPTYNYVGPILQAVASYPYPPPQDARREWKPLAPWFAAYAAADPFYPFAGRALQPLAPYQRDATFPQLSVRFTVSADTIAPQPLARFDRRDLTLPQLATLYPFPPPPVALVSSTQVLSTARAPEVRVEILRQWFALYSPANPIYPFSGRVVQPLAPYLRDTTLLPQLSARFTQGTAVTYVPYQTQQYVVTADASTQRLQSGYAPFTASDSIPFATLARWDLRIENTSPQPLIRFTSGTVQQVPYTTPMYSAHVVDGTLQQPAIAWAPFIASDTVLSAPVSRAQIREPWLPQRFTLVGAPATASDAITPTALMRSQAREREGLWQQPKDYGTANLTTPSAFNFAGPKMQLSAAYLRDVARPWLAEQRLPTAFLLPAIWTSDPRYLVRLEARNYTITLNARSYTVTMAKRNWKTVLAARDYKVTLLKRNWRVRR